MKIWMVRTEVVPHDCAGDPVSLHLTREDAEAGLRNPGYAGRDLWIDEWDVPGLATAIEDAIEHRLRQEDGVS